MDGKPKYALFGAAPDTSNRGVSALYRSVVEGFGRWLPASQLLVFDSGTTIREEPVALETGALYDTCRIGAHGGRRYYSPNNLATMAALSSMGGLAGSLHPVLGHLDACRAVLDVSGGDSFSDIYGDARFWSVIRPKQIAARRRLPLILMPQTYGPFVSENKRALAKEVVLSAKMAWARDPRSFASLRDLVGRDFDPSRHRLGVDMAFGLSTTDPGEKLDNDVRQWLSDDRDRPVLGLNLSGLIALDPVAASKDFSVRANYIEAMTDFVTKAMQESECLVLIVPHVMSKLDSMHSDRAAGLKLLESLPVEFHSRIHVAPRNLDEREVKWLISRTDWFCGTRMHSTIAALSSGVPTATVPYSDKAMGVFETCGLGDQVIDPRTLDTGSVTHRLVESFHVRTDTKERLAASLPTVLQTASSQFEEIAKTLKAPGSIDRDTRAH